MKKQLLLMAFLFSVINPSFAEEKGFKSALLDGSRIIGGVKSTAGSWPSTVALLKTDTYDLVSSGNSNKPAAEAHYWSQTCGGALIASNWVVTAAHCVVDSTTGAVSEPSKILSLVGTSDLLSGGSIKSIKTIIVHPDYNVNTLDSDIALLELNAEAIEPLVGFSIDVPTGAGTTVVGWGNRDSTGGNVYPSDLFEVDLPIIDRATCANSFNAGQFTDNMICAGFAAGGKDACQGDSGGPLFAKYSGQTVLVGITSWGIGCAQPALYGVYTRVFNFQSWINGYIPLVAINTAMTANTESNLTITDYTNASVSNVTNANLSAINTVLANVISADLPLSMVQIQSHVDQSIAVAALNAAMTGDTESSLTLTSYSTAGIINVTASNLAAVNTALERAATTNQPLTTAQIQSLVDGVNASVEPATRSSGGGPFNLLLPFLLVLLGRRLITSSLRKNRR